MARRLGCTPAAGHCAPLPTCALSLLGRTETGPGTPGPYPVTPETPASLSWKRAWVRLLIDSCWAELWQGGGGGE